MSLPHFKAERGVVADDRSPLEVTLETAASAVYGVLMAAEAEMDGEMSMTLEVLNRANQRFLEEVEGASNKDVAESYAQRLIRGIKER